MSDEKEGAGKFCKNKGNLFGRRDNDTPIFYGLMIAL
jgi:hypothetical protein